MGDSKHTHTHTHTHKRKHKKHTITYTHQYKSTKAELTLKVPWHATRCGVISRYKPFWKSAPYDITSERVHLDV